MKKEIIFQIVLVILYYLSSIIDVVHEGMIITETPGIDFLFLVYHCILFFLVNYVLIPKFFSQKKYVQLFVGIIILIILFGVIEEGLVEKILSPNLRGSNDVTWQSIYWFFGEILIPLLGLMSVKLMFDYFSQQQELEKIKQDKLENELKLLKSQVQPHVLFNSLNNLYNFALKKSDHLPDLILKLSNVLRYVLYDAAEEKVTLNKEITLIEDFVALQEIQYENRGVVSLAIEKDENCDRIVIAPFLLIPFVENCFKHSYGTLVEDVVIDIDIKVSKEQLYLFVKNNYSDEGSSNTLIDGGIGLKNVYQRLELLYPENYLLNTWTENNRYFVQLKVKHT